MRFWLFRFHAGYLFLFVFPPGRTGVNEWV